MNYNLVIFHFSKHSPVFSTLTVPGSQRSLNFKMGQKCRRCLFLTVISRKSEKVPPVPVGHLKICMKVFFGCIDSSTLMATCVILIDLTDWSLDLLDLRRVVFPRSIDNSSHFSTAFCPLSV